MGLLQGGMGFTMPFFYDCLGRRLATRLTAEFRGWLECYWSLVTVTLNDDGISLTSKRSAMVASLTAALEQKSAPCSYAAPTEKSLLCSFVGLALLPSLCASICILFLYA